MADNTQLDLGAGGDLISTDDLGGGVKVQRVKIQYGVDGAATDVSDTNPLPVDDAGGSLTVDSPQLPAALVGGRLDVVVGASLPAGNNNIGDVDVASLPALPAGTNNIGDVDVLSVVPGTGATSLGKAEDAAHVSGDTGVAMLGVRRDTAASGAGTDGDYATLNLDSSGRLYVNPGTDLAVEDAAAAANPTGVPLIARRRDTLTMSEVSATGDYIALNATPDGSLHTRSPNRSSESNQLTATGNVDLDVSGCATAFLQIGGGFTASLVFEGTSGAASMSSIQALNLGSGALESGTSSGAAQRWMIPVGGLRTLRIRVSAYTSGTVFIDVSASSGTGAALTATRLYDNAGDSCMDDTNNALRVNLVAGGGAGGTSMTDDAAFTVGVSGITPVGGHYLAARDTVNDGDAGALAMTERRALYATLETPGGDSVMDETNNAVQVRLVATDVASGGFAMADDAPFTPGTTNVNPVAGIYRSTRDLVDDNDAGALAMTQRRGLFVVLESPLGDSLIDDTNDHVKVGGTLAHDAANAVNVSPLLLGARAANSPFSAVSADGDVAMLRSDRLGQLIVRMADAAGDSMADETNNALRVNVVAGGAAGGGTSATDDSAFTVGTTPVTPMGGIYRSAGDALDDGDVGAVALTENRSQYVTLTPAAGGFGFDDITNQAIRVSIAGSIATASVVQANGTGSNGLTAVNHETSIGSAEAAGALGVLVSGTWVGTLQFEGSINGSDYHPARAYPIGGGTSVTSTTTNGEWWIPGQGWTVVRVRCSAYTSGTAVATIHYKGHGLSLDQSLITGGDAANGLDVDVTRVVPGTGASHLGKAEDAAHGDGDTGVAVLAVRRDAASSGVGADGDYAMLSVDGNGALRVTGGGGGTQYAEDAAHASGDTGTLALVVRRDTAAVGSGTDGDYSTLNVNASGRLYTSTTIDAALPAGTNNIGDVDVLSLPALPAGNNNIGDVDVASIAAGDNNIGNVDIVTMPGTVVEDAASAGGETSVLIAAVRRDTAASGVGADGDFANIGVSSAGRVWVSATIDAALPAGTNNIGDVDVLTLPGVAGAAAHDAAVSGNPLLVAGYAETPDDSAPGNQVSAEGDATRLTLDRDGALYTHPHPPRIWHVATEHTTQQTDTSVKAAPGAGLSLYITDITINCNGAVTVTLEEGTTTIKFRYYGSAAGDGTNKQFIVPLKLAANTALTVTTSGAVTCFVGVNGYTAP